MKTSQKHSAQETTRQCAEAATFEVTIQIPEDVWRRSPRANMVGVIRDAVQNALDVSPEAGDDELEIKVAKEVR